MGFKGAGTVEKLGANVQGLSAGDRVAFSLVAMQQFPWQPSEYFLRSITAGKLVRLQVRLCNLQAKRWPVLLLLGCPRTEQNRTLRTAVQDCPSMGHTVEIL